MNLLDASSRIALTAYLHDLGKLAERAGIEIGRDTLESNKQLYCPHHKEFTDARGWFSHVHAAYTGIGWDALEATRHFPDLRQNSPPFATSAEDNVTDSAINAASAHHKPDTFLQWTVATADRVASGFERDKFDTEYNNQRERDNHYCSRLLSLFEQVNKTKIEEGQLKWRYPLKPLSPENIFPQKAETCTPTDNATAKAEYHVLWNALLDGIKQIPKSHLANLPLWLDHFDSLWLTITHAIPSATAFGGVKPDVPLYDHSKTAAALATALWRWHHETGDETVSSVKQGWDTEKILLIQGDFFGIQDFIFAQGGQTQKHAHKLLRGRSFQVALLAELAALKLLAALQLPSTSQIINAAGKFLIVAPNTESARRAVDQCRREFDAWCIKHTFGEIGVGLASTPASCNSLVGGHFKTMIAALFAALDKAKHQRFDLCGNAPPADSPVLSAEFHHGPCEYHGRYPADFARNDDKPASCELSRDQISIGESLTKQARLLVLEDSASFSNPLELDYFGYRLVFVPAQDISGKYGELGSSGALVRAWDFDLPDANGTLFRGYARRFVNTYVPLFDDNDQMLADKYGRWEDEVDFDQRHPIKTLHHIACESRRINAHDKWQGEVALVTLKGDIDNLGSIFQHGMQEPTFAKMAGLSRQVNAFFAIWLPWFCEHGESGKYRNTYTVFAGGDDFFLMGPWEQTLELAGAMRSAFARYVARDDMTFSLGATMTHAKVPARHLAVAAERGLAAAKNLSGKNAISLWNATVNWQEWEDLMLTRRDTLSELSVQAGGLSTGFIYSLLLLADQAERDQSTNEDRQPEDSLWRSRLAYRCARLVKDKTVSAALAVEIGAALTKYRGAYRLPVSQLLYRQRD